MAYGKRGGGNADIQTKVIKVLSRQDYDKGGASELRIISWIVNGSTKPPTLERREKWATEGGEERAGKAKGLSASDVWYILENMHEIGKLMEIPAAKIAGLAGPAPETAGIAPSENQSSGGGDPWGN